MHETVARKADDSKKPEPTHPNHRAAGMPPVSISSRIISLRMRSYK